MESHTDRLSTIEAIARAMGILEGARVFRVMVERTLWAKGALDVPRGVMRHDPKSGAVRDITSCRK